MATSFPKPPGPQGRRPQTIMRSAGIPVLIGTAQPTITRQGHFKWPVRFKLASAAPQDGWIIQKITATTCTFVQKKEDEVEGRFEVWDGQQWLPRLDPTVQYWEAWQVRKDAVFVDHGNRLTDYDDEYEQSGTANSRGLVKVEGWAKFYLGDLPGNFLRPHPRTRALALMSTDMRPVFWSETGATKHDLMIRWSPDGATCITYSPGKGGPYKA